MTPRIRAALEAALLALPEGEAKDQVRRALAEFDKARVDAAGKRAAMSALDTDPATGF